MEKGREKKRKKEKSRRIIDKKKEEVRTDVTSCKIGRTAYANAVSGSTGMR